MTVSEADAKKYALRLLSYRGRSERELTEKLRTRGFGPDVIVSTLEYLKRAGFVDDALLAESLKRQAYENKLYGYGGAKLFLAQRGLSKEVIEAALDYDETVELEKVYKLVARKKGTAGKSQTVQDRRRLWNFLARRGYSPETIKKAMRSQDIDEEAL
ncbi:MAG: regulatory protein RecX [Nitrospirae bacterium]|nr:MAG: regulatory protein RecX [Nitrospirota bacterium]